VNFSRSLTDAEVSILQPHPGCAGENSSGTQRKEIGRDSIIESSQFYFDLLADIADGLELRPSPLLGKCSTT
jgi:hypothetical protein